MVAAGSFGGGDTADEVTAAAGSRTYVLMKRLIGGENRGESTVSVTVSLLPSGLGWNNCHTLRWWSP